MNNIKHNSEITTCEKCFAPRFFSEINHKLHMCNWCEIEYAVEKFGIKNPFYKKNNTYE